LFLERLRADPKVDASRVYLLGFSQGAMLGLSLAASDPQLLAGVVAIGGRPLGLAGTTKRGAMPRVLIVHGLQDARVPFANAAESQRVLEALGRSVEVRAYDAGHEISAAMLADVDQWLAARLNETDAPPGG
ncbi:MAG TPA: prolyl oligopeptidase family serine peptidase, partial [Archangium sp.]